MAGDKSRMTYSVISSFSNDVLSVYYVSGPVLNVTDIMLSKIKVLGPVLNVADRMLSKIRCILYFHVAYSQ